MKAGNIILAILLASNILASSFISSKNKEFGYEPVFYNSYDPAKIADILFVTLPQTETVFHKGNFFPVYVLLDSVFQVEDSFIQIPQKLSHISAFLRNAIYEFVSIHAP